MESQRREPQLGARRQHRLVGKIDHRAGARSEPPERRLGLGLDRPPVQLVERARAELLLPAAKDDASEPARALQPVERLAYGGRVVLAVDERDHGAVGHLVASRAPSRPAATGPSRTRTSAGRTTGS